MTLGALTAIAGLVLSALTGAEGQILNYVAGSAGLVVYGAAMFLASELIRLLVGIAKDVRRIAERMPLPPGATETVED